jgi:hypothetical protein
MRIITFFQSDIMSQSLRNLPPSVARELRRHVSPKPLAKPEDHLNENLKKQRNADGRLPYILGGAVLLTATAASFPLIASWWIGNLNERESALTAPQVRRGAFLNSGSRDVGRDPEWDFQKGQHKSKAQSGYGAAEAEMEQEQKPSKLHRQAHVMGPGKMAKYEKDLEAFAKGERRKTA